MIFRPVAVDPVNATLSTSMWDDKAAPPTGPKDGMVFTTPGGNLESFPVVVITLFTFRHSPCFLDELRQFLMGLAGQDTVDHCRRVKDRTNAVKGVSSDGFITTVHPTANAGATFQDLQVFRDSTPRLMHAAPLTTS